MARTVSFDVLAVAHGVGFDELGMKIKGVARDSQTHISGLVAALTAVGPAMLPIGAAATAVGAGLAGLGAAGLVAFLALNEQWKAGILQATALGQQITKMNLNFQGLKATTATAIAPGLTVGLKAINSLTVPLGFAFEKLAGQLGKIAGNVAPALVLIFLKLMPLFTGIGDQLVRLSAGFLRWAQNGTGVTKFVDYAQASLPKVEKVLGQLVVAIGRLSSGLLPLGGISLSTIGIFAKFVNTIPVPVLKEIAPIIYGIILATKGWEIAQKALNIVVEANPFVRLAIVILAVGTALVEAYKHSETFRDVVAGVFHYVKTAALDLGIGFIKYLEIPVLDVFSTIIHGAAAAFGWVPGIGGKLKAARAAFDQFRRDADKALHGMEATLNTENARASFGDLVAYLKRTAQQRIELDLYTKHIDEFVTKRQTGTPTQNAGGGMVPEGWSTAGEQGWEWLYKSGPQVQVFAHGTGGPQPMAVSAPRVTNNVTINVLNGDPRATVRALEQWAGGGGKIHISRAVA